MKKVLLFSLLFIITISTVFAYETIIIKFPRGENWVKAYYKKVGNEALLQYVPKGQSSKQWQRTIVIHSYNDSAYTVSTFMANSLAKMMKANPTGEYRYVRLTDNDAIATRCTNNYKQIEGQCEFFRGTYAHGGMISLHYINKNKTDFKNNYNEWYKIIKHARLYNSYYRDERILDKAEYFEL